MVGASDTAVLVAFGAVVREVRLERGYSQEAFAERANLHRTYIGGIERGERNVALINIRRIAAALDVPMASLFAATEARLYSRRRQARRRSSTTGV